MKNKTNPQSFQKIALTESPPTPLDEGGVKEVSSTQKFKKHLVSVSDLHTLEIKEFGNSEGSPVIVFPEDFGSNSFLEEILPKFSDLEKHRFVTFDYRGTGSSTPSGDLRENSTQELLEDVEAIRNYFNLSEFSLLGGGFGGGLAILYAIQNPEKINSLTIWDLSLGREEDLKWPYQEGANYIFPEAWQVYKYNIEKKKRKSFLKAYYEMICFDTENHLEDAKNFAFWEEVLNPRSFQESPEAPLNKGGVGKQKYLKSSFCTNNLKIKLHYLVNSYFLSDRDFFRNIDEIKDIPKMFLHNRYNFLNPIKASFDLQRALDEDILEVFESREMMLDRVVSSLQNSQSPQNIPLTPLKGEKTPNIKDSYGQSLVVAQEGVNELSEAQTPPSLRGVGGDLQRMSRGDPAEGNNKSNF